MLTSINMTTSKQDMDRFSDRKHLREFYRQHGIDGIELMPVGEVELPDKVTREDINGVHLSFLPYWYEFWRGNTEALNRQFGEEKLWQEYYGGSDRTVLLERLTQELDFAQQMNAGYVVFHISESSLDECLTFQQIHTDEEICDAAAEIINAVLDKKEYRFEFLCENLWWSGMTLVRPEITKRMMDAIHYEKKGIMLDTGHLLHTNRSLRTQEEGVQYIHEILDRNGELCRYIRGIHLQQSLCGEYVERFLQEPRDLNIPCMEKMMLVFPHIFEIDRHKPFTAKGVSDLIRRIAPEYLTYELITENNEVHEAALKEQLLALKDLEGLCDADRYTSCGR